MEYCLNKINADMSSRTVVVVIAGISCVNPTGQALDKGHGSKLWSTFLGIDKCACEAVWCFIVG